MRMIKAITVFFIGEEIARRVVTEGLYEFLWVERRRQHFDTHA